MKFPVFLFAMIPIIFVATACETQKYIGVTVVDKLTKQPIDSVYIEVKAGKNGNYHLNYRDGYTSHDGTYETTMMIGCTFGCYDIYMEYSKEGYQFRKDLNLIEGTIEPEPGSDY